MTTRPNIFRQESGEITARFSDTREKTALVHKGSPAYCRVFYLLVCAGTLYLAGLFIFIR